jgi:hypothetical protein
MRRTLNVLAVLLAVGGCAPRHASAPATPSSPPVIRQFLSGVENDWEPSLAIGGDQSVTVIAGRRAPSLPGAPPESQIVTWSSFDSGQAFRPAAVFAAGGGDERIKADHRGILYASWIRIEIDSTGRGIDLTRGGLVLAVSRDHGLTWTTTIAASMPSGVADKPELAVSPDGRDVYIAFMARGTLDVVASHDGGAHWERHSADTTRTGYWPTSIALGPSGELLLTNVKNEGSPRDTILTVATQLFRSTDQGRTWRQQVISRSARMNRIGDCVHGPTCPVQIAYGGVAIDSRHRVYLVYTEGTPRHRYDLRWIRSLDGGETWSAPKTLSAAPRPASGDLADTFYPMIATLGDGLVYVAWFDDREGPLNLWAKRSNDGGVTWSEDVRLSRAEGVVGIYGEYGGIGIDARGALHVAWSEGVGHINMPNSKGGTWFARWDGRVPAR